MNKDSLKTFLKRFNISEEQIEELLQNKEIKKIKSNYFLIEKNQTIKENQVFTDTLIYIQLQKLLPSKYLLEIIYNLSKNKCELTNQKQVDKFLFFKDLTIQGTKTRNLKENQYHIVTFENKILGICEYKKEEKYQIVNIFNIGEYLRE